MKNRNAIKLDVHDSNLTPRGSNRLAGLVVVRAFRTHAD